jgi:hypothetical protein
LPAKPRRPAAGRVRAPLVYARAAPGALLTGFEGFLDVPGRRQKLCRVLRFIA